MPKFRKKPVIIEAFQMTKERRWNNSEWPEWLNRSWNLDPKDDGCLYCIGEDGLVGPGERLCITTLEGTHAVTFGDWIIKGIKGELYPCKADIFEATHEPLNGPNLGVYLSLDELDASISDIESQLRLAGAKKTETAKRVSGGVCHESHLSYEDGLVVGLSRALSALLTHKK